MSFGGGGKKLISLNMVCFSSGVPYTSLEGRNQRHQVSFNIIYAVKSAFLDYELRTSQAKEVKGQMSIVTHAVTRCFGSI